jgi:hypothetical protein
VSDDQILLTPAEAESVLLDGPYIHNYANPGAGMFIGCDMERDRAIEALGKAVQLEIGGPACQNMKHGLVVWTTDNRPLFFEADPEKLSALEARKLSVASHDGDAGC